MESTTMAIKEFLINGKTVAVEILEQHPSYFKFKINDKTFEVSIEDHNPAKQILNFVVNNHPVKIKYLKQQNLEKQFNNENLLIYIINHCAHNHCAQILIEPVEPQQKLACLAVATVGRRRDPASVFYFSLFFNISNLPCSVSNFAFNSFSDVFN